DQHLASIVRYGVDEFEDSGFAFSGPALNNLWPRRWWPTLNKEHVSHDEQPPYTGDFEDGFGNKISVYAVANPHFTGREPSRIYDRATGYGMVIFDTVKRNIHIECWPRFINPDQQPDGQYEGWPITISQKENYGRKYTGFLPEITVKGISEPIFDVFNEKNEELIYSFPSPEPIFKPGVFENGLYSIHIRDANSSKTEIIKNLTTKDVTPIHVDFS
ncbi:MAG: twin-arginine translocation pathway signal protein, partial [Cyclobacteriaceae bacterium]|nr:twin-arginine translocation pathway signal protein [Cyclobacteriaceae bacterium]